MRRKIIVAALVVGAYMAGLFVGAGPVDAATYVSKGTARLLTHRVMNSLEAHDPQSGRYTTSRPCHRVNRRHVDCYFVRRVTLEGVAERTDYTSHVRATPSGWAARTTNRGPVEDTR